MIVVLLASLIAVGCTAPATVQTVHPELLALTEQQPDSLVRVIVQKRSAGDSVEQLVNELGGVVVRDLRIINGLAAEMPAGAVVQLAASNRVRWVSLDAPMRPTQIVEPNASPEPGFIAWATAPGKVVQYSFVDVQNIVDAELGPAGTYGYGDESTRASFSGFEVEVSPGYAIAKVEAVLYGYADYRLKKGSLGVQAYLDGSKIAENSASVTIFDAHTGVANAGPIYLDITGTHAWQWGDFQKALEIVVDRSQVYGLVHYDAVGLRVSIAAGADLSWAMQDQDDSLVADQVVLQILESERPEYVIDRSRQVNVYNNVIGVEALWDENSQLLGGGVAVAVVDSGVLSGGDLDDPSPIDVNFNRGFHDAKDRFGHGTFVASLIAGKGKKSFGIHIGVAPKAKTINVRVSDDAGGATASDVVAGLQWVYENADKYNIRVVNLSLNSSVADSYLTDPLCAAVEMLWLRGIVVVVSAGNNGTATLFPPANDPFVITVGATDDAGTATLADDTTASFSAYGTTDAGYAKPDLVTPGRNIIAYLPKNKDLRIAKEHPNHQVTEDYFRMSGTSMAAPMVSGAVALLLQDEPNLTPDQVKYRLLVTANKDWPGYDPAKAGAGYLDIYAAVHKDVTESANIGVPVSRWLWESLASTVGAASTGTRSTGTRSTGTQSTGTQSTGTRSTGTRSTGTATTGTTKTSALPAAPPSQLSSACSNCCARLR